MRVNVDKVLKRDEILSELDDRADALQVGASQFESSAAKLKRKYWWKNCKMMIMLGAICAIIVVVIVSKYCRGCWWGEEAGRSWNLLPVLPACLPGEWAALTEVWRSLWWDHHLFREGRRAKTRDFLDGKGFPL